MEDDKYVVFKRAEFERWVKVVESYILEELTPLDDATVIRGQDLFAAPAFDVYAGSIAIVLKFGGMTEEKRINLQRSADYFHERANESRAIAFKIPD